MATSRKIFIDSSLLVAFVDRADPNHSKAVKAMEGFAQLKFNLYTSSQNIMDVYAALSREVGLSVALEFLQAALQSEMEILFPQKADLVSAYRMTKSNRDRQVSLKETVNAVLMQKRGIAQIATFTYWHNLFGTYVSNVSA